MSNADDKKMGLANARERDNQKTEKSVRSNCAIAVEVIELDEEDNVILTGSSNRCETDSEESDIDEEKWEDWDDTICIDDDEDDLATVGQIRKGQQCFRCSTKRLGTFRTAKEYYFHIRRHLTARHFACINCKWPFSTMTECIAHEIRQHNLEYDEAIMRNLNDPIITAAKITLMAKQDAKTSETSEPDKSSSDNTQAEFSSTTGNTKKTSINPSTTMFPYTGPTISYVMESYEIQVSHANKKSHRSNFVSNSAIDMHRLNVSLEHDTFKLGRFSRRKAPSTSKKSKKTTAKRHRSKEQADVSSDPQPRRKKSKMSSSSSLCSSSSASTLSETTPAPKGPVFQALLQPRCQLCGYKWSSQNDLRDHRDKHHDGVSLAELMTLPRNLASDEKSDSDDEDLFTEITVSKRKGKSSSLKSKRGRKRKMENEWVQVSPCRPAPIPDATFTAKEIFLDALGLCHKIRLHLHQKRPVRNLNLPNCSVVLERLSLFSPLPREAQSDEDDIEIIRNDYSNSSSQIRFFSDHFLLGNG